ncbi:MAG: hypothetical protein K8I00_10735 [Candidatus Omnitrophica bacterium]|nr:hypothetical protein [Candidatus Omnitrophota bacterium]
MMKNTLLMTLILSLVLVNTAMASLSEQKVQEVLDFTKAFIMEESKDSGIFSLKRPDGKEEQWFELFGILGDIKEVSDSYVVTVDVDVLGYKDQNYLLYFVVKQDGDGYNLDEIRIGPRFNRKASQKLSIPE